MDYLYTREKAGGMYNIDNPNRTDLELNQIHLAKEIEAEITKNFTIICNDGECKIVFEEALTDEEKDTLDIIVENHKNNI